MTKLELLQRGIRVWVAVIYIRVGAFWLVLGWRLCESDLALVEVALGDSSLLGVCKCGPRGSLSGLLQGWALGGCLWRRVFRRVGAISGYKWRVGESRADESGLEWGGVRASDT